jgi:hypothetical protein
MEITAELNKKRETEFIHFHPNDEGRLNHAFLITGDSVEESNHSVPVAMMQRLTPNSEGRGKEGKKQRKKHRINSNSLFFQPKM